MTEANELRNRCARPGEAGRAFEYRVAKNNAGEAPPIAGTDDRVVESSSWSDPRRWRLPSTSLQRWPRRWSTTPKDNELFEIKGGVVDGELVDVAP